MKRLWRRKCQSFCMFLLLLRGKTSALLHGKDCDRQRKVNMRVRPAIRSHKIDDKSQFLKFVLVPPSPANFLLHKEGLLTLQKDWNGICAFATRGFSCLLIRDICTFRCVVRYRRNSTAGSHATTLRAQHVGEVNLAIWRRRHSGHCSSEIQNVECRKMRLSLCGFV